MAGPGQLSLPRSPAPRVGWPSPGGVWARVQARLRRSPLDRALAAGEAEHSSPTTSVRAAQLIGTRSRRQLAGALATTRDTARRPAPGRSSAIAPDCGEVFGASDQMIAIEEMLLSSRPIAARGVALLRVVLTDPAGPLFAPPNPGAFKHHLFAVIRSLDGVRSAA